MSGHSRWHQIRHRKALTDSKKGQLFSKISRLISIAVKEAGPNPDENPKLRDALEKAKAEGMSGDTVERAIQRGKGEADAQGLSEALYEGYGPGGSALLIEAVSDNLNRTNHELRKIMEGYDGKLVGPGSVSWMFERKVVADVSLLGENLEKGEFILIDAGAEEIKQQDDRMVAVINPEKFPNFRETLAREGIAILDSSFEYVPRSRLELNPGDKNRLIALFEKLDDHSDVQEIYTNANL